MEKRDDARLRSLMEVAEIIHQSFLSGCPVDKSLTAHFRKYKKFGSKDRRFISTTLFGFYRWYGWLNELLPEDFEKALLLGYLLDEGERSPLIQGWQDKLGLTIAPLLSGDGLKQPIPLTEKWEVVKKLLPGKCFSDLNPDFIGAFSEDTLNAFQTRPPVWLRACGKAQPELLKSLEKQSLNYRVNSVLKNAVAVEGRFNINEMELYRQGKVEIQDLTSQAIGVLCAPQEGDVWWDVCSGAGGKALQLADLTGNRSTIYATEIREVACRELEKRARRGKWRAVRPVLWDGEVIPDFSKSPERILVDAPCSCSGTWRRSPDVRWRMTKDRIKELADIQLSILKRAASVSWPVKDLFYATCSILPEENEQVIEKFLATHPDYELAPLIHPFTGESIASGIQFLPPEVDGIAMFVARLKPKR